MKQKPTVYLETSFISYLCAEPSHDLTTLQRQVSSRDWWTSDRHRFALVISQAVIDECQAGNARASELRMQHLQQATILDTSATAATVAESLIFPNGPLPTNARVDALHIAVSTVEACDYLLTWNLKHIANPYIRRMVDTIIRGQGYESPVIVTADQLIEGATH